MISSATRPIREEHRELLPHIERLRVTADEVGQVSGSVLRGKLEDAYTFLTHQLIPHAMAEDEVLYPAVGRLMGAAQATATMSHDHGEVVRLTEELRDLRSFPGDDPDPRRANDLRRVLYGLYELVRTHFAEEEEMLPADPRRASDTCRGGGSLRGHGACSGEGEVRLAGATRASRLPSRRRDARSPR